MYHTLCHLPVSGFRVLSAAFLITAPEERGIRQRELVRESRSFAGLILSLAAVSKSCHAIMLIALDDG